MVGHSILQLYHTGQLQSVTSDTLKDGKTQKKKYVVLQPTILLLGLAT